MPNIEIIYTAIVLTDGDQLAHLVPDGWTKFCHHMTLTYKKQIWPDNLGKQVILTATKIYQDSKAVAVEVIAGERVGHVTVATHNVPPVYSNELIKSAPARDCKFILHGKVGAYVSYGEGTKAKWIYQLPRTK